MKKSIYMPKALFWLMLLIAACYAALSETGMLPTDYASSDNTALYGMELLSVGSCLVGVYFALRLFAFERVKQEIGQDNAQAAKQARRKWELVRTAIIAAALWTNVALYYASSYTNNPKYCLLIALIACVFCRPSDE